MLENVPRTCKVGGQYVVSRLNFRGSPNLDSMFLMHCYSVSQQHVSNVLLLRVTTARFRCVATPCHDGTFPMCCYSVSRRHVSDVLLLRVATS